MASVRKRKWTHNGAAHEAWVVEYTDQAGRRRRFTPKSGLKKDADKERLRIEKEIEVGEHVARSKSMLLREGCELFIKECERRHKVGHKMTGQTLNNYKKAVDNHLAPFLGGKVIAEISPGQIQSFFDDLCNKLALRSVHNYAMTTKLLFDFFVRRKFVLKNVARDREVILPDKPKDRRVIPGRDELRHLFDIARLHHTGERRLVVVNSNLILKLGVLGGLRVGEMSALRWERVDFDSGLIRIEESNSRFDGIKKPKTEAGRRIVPMTPPVREALLDVLRYWHAWEDSQHLAIPYMGISRRLGDCIPADLSRPRSGFVFRAENQVGADVRPLRAASLSRYWEGLMRRAELATQSGRRHWRPKYTIHDMRHVAASLFIEAGLPAINLKSVMGHASASTTFDVYGHMFPEDVRIATTAAEIAINIAPAIPQIAFQKPARSVSEATTKRQQPVSG